MLLLLDFRRFALGAAGLVACLALASSAPGQKEPANAGTGPYEIVGQWGQTVYLPGAIKQSFYRFGLYADKIRAEIDSHPINPNIGEYASRLFRLASDRSIAGDPLCKYVISTLRNYDAQQATVSDLAKAVGLFLEDLRKTALSETAKTERTRLSTLKVGTFVTPHATFAFDSLCMSAGDRKSSSGRPSTTSFVEISSLVTTSGSGFLASGRGGLGLAFGNPDTMIWAVEAASFVSPFAVDAGPSLSVKLAGDNINSGGPATPATMALISHTLSQRSLLDHVRPGDWWFDCRARWISNAQTSEFRNGFLAEGSFTYALRQCPGALDSDLNPMASTALTFSAVASNERRMGADELGFALRTPLARGVTDSPLYLSARYGTRGDFTFAIEGRFGAGDKSQAQR